MTVVDDQKRRALLRRGFALEYATLAWNVAGIVVLSAATVSARSMALAGFALDSLIEISASTVVISELSGSPAAGPAAEISSICSAVPAVCSFSGRPATARAARLVVQHPVTG